MWRRAIVVLAMALLAAGSPGLGRAESFADPAFQALWAMTDEAVASGAAQRGWVWGPEPITTGRQEPYAEAPGGQRLVQYFDKGRMELTRPGGPVTSGLLAKELMTGQVQTGDSRTEQRPPATIALAGDENNELSPTYAVYGQLIGRPPLAENAPIVEVVDRDGSIGADAVLARYGVRAGELIPQTGHRLASVFESYFAGEPLPNTEGETPESAPFAPWYETTGLPLTEAYWTRARVGGIVRDVLAQGFERRVLTYTPANPAGSRVEMGNVGRHYLAWRAQAEPTPTGFPCPTWPEPPVDEDAQYVLLSSALHSVGGRSSVTGMVRNDGPSSAAIRVVVTRLTADGRSLGRVSGFTDRDFWPNGQAAAFQIDLPAEPPTESWTVELGGAIDEPSGGLAGGFEIGQLQGAVDGLGVSRVTGQLRYTGAEPFTDLAIVRVYAQDDCGNLVTAGFARAGSGAIQPGSVTPFSALLLRAEGATRLRAVVEARTGNVSRVADDALRVYDGGLFPAPDVPIVSVDGCCQYIRSYQRPDGTPVRSVYRRPNSERIEE
jgi:hypothetical protein